MTVDGMAYSQVLPAVACLLLLLLLLRPALSASQLTETKPWEFTLGQPFDDSYRRTMSILGAANVNAGALQLTPDTRSSVSYVVNKSGRVLYPQPFRLWTSGGPGGVLRASFQTSFDFNLYQEPDEKAGEGMAFVIVPDATAMPLNSAGGYLGLTNATTDGSLANKLVAVEFDTIKQSYDPDDNHVGLNINSVHSAATSPLTVFNLTNPNLTASPLNGTLLQYYLIRSPETVSTYTAWVDYDGPSARITVHMTYAGMPKPPVAVLTASLDLSQHVAGESYLGFAASTGQFWELNCVFSWNLSVDALPGDGGQSSRSHGGIPRVVKRMLEIPLPAIVLSGLTVLAVRYMCRRRVRGDQHLTTKLKCLPGMPREFPYKHLKRATENFDAKNKLGQGGFGVVYRGVLPGDNTPVAVKKFSRETMQGDFLAELTIISRLRHKHLVRLLGWSRKHSKLLLVYEYMPNGSLDTHLFGAASPENTLRWEQRYTILRDVAAALHYLHDEYDQKVVHRDLKASNIMLDADFNARLGDFGLARAIDDGRTSYADAEVDGVAGTLGYIAPECFFTGKATRESDVFGFGAVVLEVVCGRRPRCDIDGFRFLADWVWKLHREGRLGDAVDPRLGGGGGYVAEDAERLLLLGLACSHPVPGERPKADVVVQIISKSVHPPHVPPFRPALVWPAGAGEKDGSTSSVSWHANSGPHTHPCFIVGNSHSR